MFESARRILQAALPAWLRELPSVAAGFSLRKRNLVAAAGRPEFAPYRPALEFLEDRLTPSTYWVNQAHADSSDFGPGTQSEPFSTITAAAALAVAGDTVLVASGLYDEMISIRRLRRRKRPHRFFRRPGRNVFITGHANGFDVSGQSWITIKGFHIQKTASYGINLFQSSFIRIEQNEVSYSGLPAEGLVASGIRATHVANSWIIGNVSHHNTDAGILVSGTSSGNSILGNEAYRNARRYTRAGVGIDIRSTNNVVGNNVVHDNEDSGIQVVGDLAGTQPAHDNLIVNNIAYKNGDHGIDVLRAPGQRVIANTVYKNVAAGINLEGEAGHGSTGGTLANNISVNNAINGPRTRGNIRVDAASIAGTTLDYNLVFMSIPGQVMLTWGVTDFATLAAFQIASGMESHGLQVNPLFVNGTKGDFRLQAASPAIDSADSAASGQSAADHKGLPRRDTAAVKDTGTGPRTFDDRGALEIQIGQTVPIRGRQTSTAAVATVKSARRGR